MLDLASMATSPNVTNNIYIPIDLVHRIPNIVHSTKCAMNNNALNINFQQWILHRIF